MFLTIIVVVIAFMIALALHHQRPLESIFKEDEELQLGHNEATNRGAAGEKEIQSFLQTLPGKYVIFQSLYLPLKNEKNRTEIDLLVVHEKGIFVIESKNYTGHIVGNETEKNWYKIYSNNFQQSFYNPILQNETHINAIKRLFPTLQEDDIYSFIVFGKEAELHVSPMPARHIFVLKTTQIRAIHDVLRASESKIDYKDFVNQLAPYSNSDFKIKTNHVKRLKNKYGKKVLY